MCGIAGIIQTNPSLFTADHLKKMTDALAHRGPDGEGFWRNDDGAVLLGHRRLSVIDLTAGGKQPMLYLNRYVIIHNGEIYNYIELKDELQKKGYRFQTKTDTEVIVAAYDCWKEDCLFRFDGMFAFAIWDEKEKILFAARDRLGEKPFFYYRDNEKLLFASEMKALWAAGINRTANLKMLFNFIAIGYTGNPNRPEETFYNNIAKLPPACFIKTDMRSNGFQVVKYWDIEAMDPDEIKDDEAVEEFSTLLQTSVRRRLRSDVAIGSSLSGGLDSSAIAAITASLIASPPQFTAFTAVFSGSEKDESACAKKIADKFSLRHCTIDVSANDLINDFEKLCYHQEEPFDSASVLAQYKVYGLAKQHDTKVLLDGQGADEILAGYHKYYKWYWQELFQKRKLLRSGELKAAKENGIAENFGLKNIIASLFPDLASVFLEKKYVLNALRRRDLTREFVQQQSKEAYYTAPPYFNLNGVLYFNTIQYGLEELLRYADRNSMAHGREVRLPFLNHELVEFLFTLPAKFKIRNGWTKWLLRKSMENKLPSEITWRLDKTGFEPPQKQWMEHKKVQEIIQEAKMKLVKENILRPGILNKKIQPHDAYAAESYDWRYLSAAFLFTPIPTRRTGLF
jgi:asparagine synthase (glutamine-hydrolysing)